MPPEKGSTIITVEKIQEYDLPVRVPKTIQDILAEAEFWEESNKATQYNYPGGYDEAKRHFDELGPSNVVERG